MKCSSLQVVFSLALGAACTAAAGAQSIPDRTVLPIPEPEYPHSTILDARKATPPPRFEVKAPAACP